MDNIPRLVFGGHYLPKFKHSCIYCNAVLVECPEQGHPNSRKCDWLKKDGVVHWVCPNGCWANGKGRWGETEAPKLRRRKEQPEEQPVSKLRRRQDQPMSYFFTRR